MAFSRFRLADIREFIPPVVLRLRRRWLGIEEPLELFIRRDKLHAYGQLGEDLIIDAILGRKDDGFYVDVGAHHPTYLSNTKRFYDRGWRGINVEPSATLFEMFMKERPHDTNLNIGISSEPGELPFFELEPSYLSTFSREFAAQAKTIDRTSRIVAERIVKTDSLANVLEANARGRVVDFLSIDVEGYDVNVLKSNDFSRFRPRLIIVELSHRSKSILDYMSQVDYDLAFNNRLNGVFLDRRSASW